MNPRRILSLILIIIGLLVAVSLFSSQAAYAATSYFQNGDLEDGVMSPFYPSVGVYEGTVYITNTTSHNGNYSIYMAGDYYHSANLYYPGINLTKGDYITFWSTRSNSIPTYGISGEIGTSIVDTDGDWYLHRINITVNGTNTFTIRFYANYPTGGMCYVDDFMVNGQAKYRPWYYVNGTVTDSMDGQPISGASISVSNGIIANTSTTNATGQYSVKIGEYKQSTGGLPDGDFEANDPSYGWTPTNLFAATDSAQTGTYVEYDSSVKHGGTYSLKMGYTYNTNPYLFSKTPVLSAGSHHVTFWAKNDGSLTGTPRLFVGYSTRASYPPSGAVNITPITGTGEWVYYDVITPSTTGDTYLELLAYCGEASGDRTIWIDDIKIDGVGDPIRSSMVNLVVTVDATGYYQGTANIIQPNDFTETRNSTYTCVVDGSLVREDPGLDFEAAPTAGYAPMVVFFAETADAPVTGWDWNFGDGSQNVTGTATPGHTYSNVGVYTVTLTATSNGRTYTVQKPWLVNAMYGGVLTSGDTDFSAFPTTPTTSQLVQFQDLSTGSPTSWMWNFGDGSPVSITQYPTHQYKNPGTYTVTLTSAGTGWQDSKTRTNYIVVSGDTITPEFNIGQASYVYKKENTTINIPVKFDGSSETATINYTTQDGSALNTVDYITASGTLTFAPGEKVKTIPITIMKTNEAYGYNKQFILYLMNPVNGTTGSISTATISLLDNSSTTGTTSTTNSVRFIVNTGRILFYPGVTVSVYQDSALVDSKATGADGAASFSLYYNKEYTVNFYKSGVMSFTLTVIPTEQDYYVDVQNTATANLIPGSQMTDGLHQCTISVRDWLNPVPSDVNVKVYGGDGSILLYNKTTDDKGEVPVNVQSLPRYKIVISGGAPNYSSQHNYAMPRDSLTYTLYTFNLPGSIDSMWAGPDNTYTGNYSIIKSTAYYPHSVYGGANAVKAVNGSFYIRAYCTDGSKTASSVTYTLYTWNTGSNTTTQLGTSTVGGFNNSVMFQVTDPYSKNYEVQVIAHQPGGDVFLYYDYTWPGPTWRLPGVPVELYQWISLFFISAVYIGTARKMNIGMAGVTSAVATAFLVPSGWMFAWGYAIYPVITFVFVMSVLIYWRQINKGEI